MRLDRSSVFLLLHKFVYGYLHKEIPEDTQMGSGIQSSVSGRKLQTGTPLRH